MRSGFSQSSAEARRASSERSGQSGSWARRVDASAQGSGGVAQREGRQAPSRAPAGPAPRRSGAGSGASISRSSIVRRPGRTMRLARGGPRRFLQAVFHGEAVREGHAQFGRIETRRQQDTVPLFAAAEFATASQVWREGASAGVDIDAPAIGQLELPPRPGPWRCVRGRLRRAAVRRGVAPGPACPRSGPAVSEERASRPRGAVALQAVEAVGKIGVPAAQAAFGEKDGGDAGGALALPAGGPDDHVGQPRRGRGSSARARHGGQSPDGVEGPGGSARPAPGHGGLRRRIEEGQARNPKRPSGRGRGRGRRSVSRISGGRRPVERRSPARPRGGSRRRARRPARPGAGRRRLSRPGTVSRRGDAARRVEARHAGEAAVDDRTP